MKNKKLFEMTTPEINSELANRIGANFYRAYIRRGTIKYIVVFFDRSDHQRWLANDYDSELFDLL